MKEKISSAWLAVRQFIDRDPNRNPSHDRKIAALLIAAIVISILLGFGWIRNALTPGGDPVNEGPILADDGGGIANRDAILTDDTLSELAILTGDALGGLEKEPETTIQFEPDIPLDATRDVAPEVGPNRPSLVSPGSGSTVRALAPELKWSKQSGATSYHLEMSRASATDSDGYFIDPTVSMPLLSSTSVRPPAIRESGTYYWHIGVGVRGKYLIRFSSIASVRVNADPVVVSPTGAATIKRSGLALTWKALAGATSYQVQISKAIAGDVEKGYDEAVFNQSYLENVVFTPTNVPEAGTYYWHVRGIDSTNSRGPFGQSHKFVLVD